MWHDPSTSAVFLPGVLKGSLTLTLLAAGCMSSGEASREEDRVTAPSGALLEAPGPAASPRTGVGEAFSREGGRDLDLDGFTARRGDCDDADARVHPGAPDLKGDGLDQDCGGRDGQQASVGLRSSAVTSIQAAIDAAQAGDTVWVGPGTYLEHDVTFRGKAVTLASTDGAEATLIDADGQGRVMVFNSGEGQGSVVRGFTLAHGVHYTEGAGIYIDHASPVIEDCIIAENTLRPSGGMGAGIRAAYSDLVVRRSIIQDNLIQGCNGCNGAGIYALMGAPLIEDSEIRGNRIDSSQGGWGAGAFFGGSSPRLIGSTITDNHIAAPDSLGGGVNFNEAGEMRDCVVAGNSADQGGGVVITTGATVEIHHTLIRDNVAQRFGGGVWMENASPSIRYSLIHDNRAGRAGGGMHIDESDLTMASSIIAHNDAPAGGGVYAQHVRELRFDSSILAFNRLYNLFVIHYQWPCGQEPGGCYGPPVLTSSNVYASAGLPNVKGASLSTGTVSVDPRFLGETESGYDYHLSTTSLLVDAGNPGLTDVDGSRGDMGIYGGPEGDGWDLDGDGVPAWFWPGAIGAAPDGFDPGDYDCDDLDGSRSQCGI